MENKTVELRDEAMTLQENVDYVCKTFFPRWNRGRKWKIEHDERLSSQGLCDLKSRKITIGIDLENDDEVSILLIHEICHACVRRTGLAEHGDQWKGRMLKAAIRAEQCGQKTIASGLRENVRGYERANKKAERYRGESGN
jgi:hypothetical protein